ncbi:MAG: tRNA pseudouridine(38-40) synthase TruA [Spirochaetales bacterium]|nr:tRNA pseudouridine(38-40) synthase TruA [Spirochaetales bacterium]
MKRNIRLKIAYDGTDFCGWQIQNNARSVQGEIEEALKKIEGCGYRLTGSGRTDSGVHANGQIANFYTENNMPAEKFVPALNSLLTNDISIIDSMEVPENFHSRYDAKKRVYRYYIKNTGTKKPSDGRFCWTVKRKPDLANLNKIASVLTGVHDFTTFAAAGDQSESKVREIFSAVFYYEGPFIVFKIVGNAFLWRMVRSLTGTIIELDAYGGRRADLIKILNSKDRTLAGTTAPPNGLFLDRVIYDERANY